MTTFALLLAISAVPECAATGPLHRAALVACAQVAYLASGIEPVTWVALSGKESRCGQDATNPRSSAAGPWQVIAKHAGIERGSAIRPLLGWWPVNAVAAAKVAKGFEKRCKDRWPACYNDGWAGRYEGTGDAFLATVRRMERQLRAAARHNGR